MKHCIYLLLILSGISVKAQNVTISNLIKLHRMDVTDSEEYMSNLNWRFTESFDNNKGLTYLTFTQKDMNNRTIYLSKRFGENDFIGMSFYSRTKKTAYINELKTKGFILLSKEIKDGKISETYIKNNLEFHIWTKPNNEYFISCVSIN